jgi:predicted GIY-YIG superfamily endonuclease
MSFSYVYILQSVLNQGHFYVGLTDDLHARLRKHNSGRVPHTAKVRPWKIKTAITFTDRLRAAEFEHFKHHLKSAAGRAFAKKRPCEPQFTRVEQQF